MQINKLVSYSIIFIGLVLTAIVLQTFVQVLRPLAIAILLLFVAMPLAKFSKDKNIPVWITFVGLIVVVVGLMSLVGSFVSLDNVNLSEAIPKYQEKISQSSSGILEAGSKLGFSSDNITPDKLGGLAAKGAMAGLGAVRTIFSEMLLALILLMFLIQSRSGLFSLVENKYGKAELNRLQETLKKIEGDIIAYFSTKTTMSLGTAILTGVVLLLFGAKFIYISVLIIFLLNFIPIIGSIIAVLIVLLLYLLTFGMSANAIWLFAALMAVQVLFGSILEPKIAGKRLNMSPIIILISLYVWGWIWGIIGMLLSVPLTILIMLIVKHLGTMGVGKEQIVRNT
jgi:predicted PurR-regulated permease PerM